VKNKKIILNIVIAIIIVWIAKITIVISDVIASSIVLNLILKGSFLILVLYLTTLLFKETDNKKYIITVNFVITLSLLFLGSLVIDFTSSYFNQKKEKTYIQKRSKEASKVGIKIDMRNISNVAKELSAEIVYAPIMFLKEYKEKNNYKNSIFPLGGISNTLTVDCNENGPFSIYFSDRYGFNNDDKIYDSTEKKIILIGDSMVQGNCVDQKDTISGHLHNKGYQAIGLGMSGNGPLLEFAILKEYALKLNPSSVIWVYFENDIIDLKRDLQLPILRDYIYNNFTQNIINRQNEVDNFWVAWSPKEIEQNKKKNNLKDNLKKVERSFFLKPIKDLLYKFNNKYIQYDKVDSKNIDEFIEIIKKAKYESEKKGSEFYFVYLPMYESLINKEPKNKKIILNKLDNIGIKYVDFFYELKKLEDPLSLYPFRLRGHFTKEGYKLIADKIEKKFLTTN
tara:strand:+ start:6619 stop:7977 length:1359 start_codon:yes stop_codon:yes gene_type:complete